MGLASEGASRTFQPFHFSDSMPNMGFFKPETKPEFWLPANPLKQSESTAREE